MKRALVFDCNAWRQARGDVGDNRAFWKKASVVTETTDRHGRSTVDVTFDDAPNYVSKGHFRNHVYFFNATEDLLHTAEQLFVKRHLVLKTF